MKVLAPAASRRKVAEKVKVDATCEEVLPGLGVRVLLPEGTQGGELGYLINTGEGTALVVTDLLFNLRHGSGLGGFVSRYILDSTGGLKVTRIGRTLIVKDKRPFKDWLLKTAEEPGLNLITVGHGDAHKGDCRAALQHVAARL